MAAPGKLLAAVAVCSLVATTLVAQDPYALLADAERAIADGPNEAALLNLLQAGRLLRSSTPSSARDAALAKIAELEPKADLAGKERGEAEAGTGRRLLEMARAYRSRNWLPAAARLFEQAVEFERVSAAKEFAALVKQQPALAPRPAGPRTGWIQRLEKLDVTGDWKTRGDALCSPAKPSTTESAVYLTKTSMQNGRAAVSIDFGDLDAMAGLIFGATKPDTYYILDTHHFPGGEVHVGLFHWQYTLVELASGTCNFKPAASRCLELRVNGRQLTCFVDGKRLFEYTCKEPPHGNLGFFVSSATPCRESLTFHDLELGPLPDAPASEVTTVEMPLMRALWATVADAERLLKQKQLEPAATMLLLARGDAVRLQTGNLRTGLTSAIDKLLPQADSLQARRVKAITDSAQALKAVADRYAAAGWQRMELQQLTAAAQLDPETHAAAAAELARVLAKKAIDDARRQK